MCSARQPIRARKRTFCSVVSSLVNLSRTALIQRMLKDLSPEYRAAVVLRYWYDLSYTEIAEMLNTTESAVKSRLFRARQALAEKMSGAPGNAKLNFAMEGA